MLFDPMWDPPKVAGIAPVRGIAELADSAKIDPNFRLKTLIVLDLRDSASFDADHIPGRSINLPLDSLLDPNPYQDPKTMVRQFPILDKKLAEEDDEFGEKLEGSNKIVLTLSHRGHMGRLAMSVLRNRGVKAHCVMTGVQGWKATGLWGKWILN
jgi:rhodanese-related sulfurtransferase